MVLVLKFLFSVMCVCVWGGCGAMCAMVHMEVEGQLYRVVFLLSYVFQDRIWVASLAQQVPFPQTVLQAHFCFHFSCLCTTNHKV